MDWFLYDRDLRHEGVAQIYDPVSIFPVIYKISEKFMFKQIASLIDRFLSKYQCSFRKGLSAQDCLVNPFVPNTPFLYPLKTSGGGLGTNVLIRLKRGKVPLTKAKFLELFSDSSKTFHCNSHKLIIAKVNAYGFILPVLKLIIN